MVVAGAVLPPLCWQRSNDVTNEAGSAGVFDFQGVPSEQVSSIDVAMGRSAVGDRQKVLIIGPKPPPYMGPTLATVTILNSTLKDRLHLIHLDTSDHRDLSTLGVVDATNVYLAMASYIRLVFAVVTKWPAVVYIPISQTTIGYFRDAPYILISRLCGRRVVCHLRGGNFRNWFDHASWLTRMLVRFIHRLVDAQIVLGENLRGHFRGIVSKERIYVVPNGKDIDYGSRGRGPHAAKHWKVPVSAQSENEIVSGASAQVGGAAANAPKILFLANLRRKKGILDALQAVQLLDERRVNFHFQFAGDWSEADVETEVNAFIAENPTVPIEYLGVLQGKEKYRAIHDADIFFFPTFYPPEGHPWVIVEALAAGLPVVSTDQGAIIESVWHEQNGFIVEKHNLEEMAHCLQTLLDDRVLRETMGAQSRRIYEERFTEARMIEALFAALVGQHVTRGVDSQRAA